MTTKRFQWVFIKDNELELRDDGIVKKFNNERLEELLNKLHSRNKRLEEKIQRERNSFRKAQERWSKEAENKIKELSEENEQLVSEINMLKITIARNEAYIGRITHKGKWSNTSNEEKEEVIAYLQAYHQGDVKEIRKYDSDEVE